MQNIFVHGRLFTFGAAVEPTDGLASEVFKRGTVEDIAGRAAREVRGENRRPPRRALRGRHRGLRGRAARAVPGGPLGNLTPTPVAASSRLELLRTVRTTLSSRNESTFRND